MIRSLLLAAVLLATPIALPASAAAPPAGVYTYRVHHPQYGEIGTYTNRILAREDGVRVDTEIRIAVKLAFVTVYRLEADRTEEWRNGRLVAYSATTEKNGKASRVDARAQGDKVVVKGPNGTATGPAELWPANPWSPDVVSAPVIMGTASGRLYEPQVSGGEQQPVTVRGQTVAAKHYRIVTSEPNDVWFDGEGRLVKFTSVEDDQVITLTLE